MLRQAGEDLGQHLVYVGRGYTAAAGYPIDGSWVAFIIMTLRGWLLEGILY
jgi:hypothetical protein